MREILFRGKRKENGEWIKGDFCSPCNIVFLENRYDAVLGKDDCPMCNDFEVIPETVGQYTGLTDKNGKKIFEGDIVYSDDLYAEPLLVIFNENCGEFQVLFNDGYSEGFFEKYAPVYHLKVIGNIHDNPELLRTPQNDEVRE